MNSLADAVMAALATSESATNKVLVCTVEAFNASTGTVDVTPSVTVTDENGEVKDSPLLYSVNVLYPSGGNIHIQWPISKGDQGLLVFSDVSLDAWRSKQGPVRTQDARRNALSDGLFIPITATREAVTEHLEIVNGNRKIQIRSDGIDIGSNDFNGVVRKKDLQQAINDVIGYVDVLMGSHTHTGGTISGNTGTIVPQPPLTKPTAASSNQVRVS